MNLRISEEEIRSDKWAKARWLCERDGTDIYELAAETARCRMIRAEFRAKEMAEMAAKQPPAPPSPPATLVHFNSVRHLWDARTQRWTQPGIIYIGRAMPHPNFNLPASPFGNPFRIEKDSDELRADAIELYAEWITAPAQADLLAQLDSLRGQILACWCFPRRCHGEVLLQLLRERDPNATPPLQEQTPSAAFEAGAPAPEGSDFRPDAALDGASQPYLMAGESQWQQSL